MSFVVEFLISFLLPLALGLASDDFRKPQIHHVPPYRYGPDGSAGDTAGAVYTGGRYHVFALSKFGVEHSSSENLVHWIDHGRVFNLDDSGGVTIDPTDGSAIAVSAAGLIVKFSISTDSNLSTWGPLQTIFSYAVDAMNRSPAMTFPGDPLAPWRDSRDGRWYTALAIDACNRSSRDVLHDYACPLGGKEQLWTSTQLRGAKWTPAGTLLQANRTTSNTGTLPQVTEFVTPDFYAPGSMSTSPTIDTAVFMSSVYGPIPCCLDAQIPRWNFQQFLVGRQPVPGGPFEIDWARSGALDWSEFVPNRSAPAGLSITVGSQWGCCAKSAFTEEGRRVLIHSTFSNGGPWGNATENAFALPREHYFDSSARFRQSFVKELAVLRREHHSMTFNLSSPGSNGIISEAHSSVTPLAQGVQWLPVPIRGNQIEVVARLKSSPSANSTWGVMVFASVDFAEGTRVGFQHFDSARTGLVFIDRTAATGNPLGARDVRAGPLPVSTEDEELHMFVDHSIVSVIASNETAITVWSHPATNASQSIAVFGSGAPVVLELEIWTLEDADAGMAAWHHETELFV